MKKHVRKIIFIIYRILHLQDLQQLIAAISSVSLDYQLP